MNRTAVYLFDDVSIYMYLLWQPPKDSSLRPATGSPRVRLRSRSRSIALRSPCRLPLLCSETHFLQIPNGPDTNSKSHSDTVLGFSREMTSHYASGLKIFKTLVS